MRKLYFFLFLLYFNAQSIHAQLELISDDFDGFYASSEISNFGQKI